MSQLASHIDAAIDRGSAAWPALVVDRGALVAVIERAIAEAGDSALDELFVEDLYLAQACATGAPAALALFETLHHEPMASALRQLGLAHDRVDEIIQDVRTRLFVADPDRTPRIATYSGRAPLRSWLRTVATRVAVGQLRSARATTDSEDQTLATAAAADGPELEHFRKTYHSEFKRAFEDALATLDVRQRNVLRHHYVDGLTHDEIGALYNVHRSTAFRWVETARTALTKRTRSNFQQSLKELPADLDHILGLLRSHLDLSLSRVLAT